MGRAVQRRFEKREKITPDYLKHFETGDIEKTFDILEAHFKLSKDWRQAFEDHFRKTPIGIPKADEFFRWATETLNRSLQIIKRDKSNVIFKVAEYVIRDKVMRINQFEAERKANKNNEPENVKLIRKIIREESQRNIKKDNEIKPRWITNAEKDN